MARRIRRARALRLRHRQQRPLLHRPRRHACTSSCRSTASPTTCAATTRARSASNWSTRGRYPRLAGFAPPGDGRGLYRRADRRAGRAAARAAARVCRRCARSPATRTSTRHDGRRHATIPALQVPRKRDPGPAVPVAARAGRRWTCSACSPEIATRSAAALAPPDIIAASSPPAPPMTSPSFPSWSNCSRSSAWRTTCSAARAATSAPSTCSAARCWARRCRRRRRRWTRPRPRSAHSLHAYFLRAGDIDRADRLRRRPHPRRRQLLGAPRHRDPARPADPVLRRLVPEGRGRRRAPVVDARSAQARGHRAGARAGAGSPGHAADQDAALAVAAGAVRDSATSIRATSSIRPSVRPTSRSGSA